MVGWVGELCWAVLLAILFVFDWFELGLGFDVLSSGPGDLVILLAFCLCNLRCWLGVGGLFAVVGC